MIDEGAHMMKPTSTAPQGRIISKPGAVVEVRSVPIEPRVREAISRALKQGHSSSQPPAPLKRSW